MQRLLIFILFIKLTFNSFSQVKNIEAIRVNEKIVIDGLLNDNVWKIAPKAENFLERNPTEGNPARHPSEVSILYDDYAIYVGAMMFDASPDSILAQLGERDDNLNADNFSISFDTYNQKLDAFVFSVAASGVQSDFKYSDQSFNAVWQSKVKILENGWSVEMEIPFSALRFPNGDSITWKVQIEREIRRFRSEMQWALVSKDFQNEINYWGDLSGLKDIKNPIRLQFSPYLSASMNEQNGNYVFGYGGGADMKLGLSEAFTLDMTLLPDFSQVQSDNIVKNLSAFEVVFEEQRPFFQEGVDLFSKGGLFYSRRIGGEPLSYYDADSQIDSNEILISNPRTSRLINVSKISGRTKGGTGIGFLNAVTAETFAIIKDTVSGIERNFRTNPLVNYNIISVDQNLKNNSSLSFINLNTTRANGFRDANTSAFGGNFVNKNNSFAFAGVIKVSQMEDTLDFAKTFQVNNSNDGTNLALELAKIKGAFRMRISTENISPKFDPNDLGVNFQSNYRIHFAEFKYNKYNPFWKLNQMYNTFSYNIEQNYTTYQILKHKISFNSFATLQKSFHSFFMNIESQLGDGYDLFEARVPGKVYINPGFAYFNLGVSSDYRRKFALDGSLGLGYGKKYYGGSYYREGEISPIIRFSDKFTLRPSINFLNFDNGAGFAGYDEEGNPIYGVRDVFTITNVIAAKYLFRNNLSLSLRVRHYWSNGVYRYHADLNDKGILVRNDNITTNTDFNFNAFNTDLVFAWQVAPGSFLNIVYKSALVSDEQIVVNDYFKNVQNVLKDNPLNTVTMKFIYFFDVASAKRNSM